jgi:ATP-dependent Clp protease ATP-binding subunit ClpA
MFERYTEKARKVIFFARYEASQFGSVSIETEHLLLGILREDKAIANRLSYPALTEEFVRRRIGELKPPREKVPTGVDMPLSGECKRILGYAAEEAERLQHRHIIGPEHLLLGLLVEEQSLGAKLLTEAGVNIAELREALRHTDRDNKQSEESPVGRSEEQVRIHGELWSAESVRELAEFYHRFNWERRRWTLRDALAKRSDRTLFLYSGQAYDPQQVELVKGGWNEDHCAICWWKLCLSDSLEHSEAFTNGQDWLCTECFERFVKPQGSPQP